MFSVRHQFDTEDSRAGFDFTQILYNSQETLTKPRSFVEYRRSSEGTIGKAVGSIRDEKDCSKIEEVDLEEPYHVFTRFEKWTLVAIAGAAGSFPTLTFNMYLPALDRIATDFKTSAGSANLAIMAYLLVQGVAPLLWGPLSDSFGRRSVYLVAFSCYVASCIVLSFSPSYAVLLLFRMVQAASITSTVSIGYAILRDISPPDEGDRFHDVFQGIRNGSFIMSPVLGGLLSNWTDFRCSFVFLFALSTTVLLAIAFFLPETLRSIAGNGTIPLAGIHQPLVWKCRIFGKPAHVDESLQPAARPITPKRRFIEPLRLFKEKDILLSLLFSSMVFMVWMMVTVSTTGLFKKAFGINEALLGLAFVPNFLGAIAGSALVGNLLDADLKRACSAYKHVHFLPSSTRISLHTLPTDFPIEHTRLARVPTFTVTLIIPLAFYGYALAYSDLTSLGGWICIVLVLQFLIAAAAHAICGVHQTLISDLWQQDGSEAASATSNLVRCMFAAIGVAVLQNIIECIGSGPTFLVLGLVVLILVPLPIVQWYFGERWRSARQAKFGDERAGQSTANI
ncbi:MFS general substrate transporter [Bimuria novae-zelandiae CBS 107.79]|uniref:MFS general substrate transporter n=1 Tax=Bimuria novae-zelandiae CBS 107.79 TaxID=1447943 RepID=A0A6A5V5X4_9PLEO|nr:MFS general substrate transporter [Bimuria novae-zelandiae CBS 107.79]